MTTKVTSDLIASVTSSQVSDATSANTVSVIVSRSSNGSVSFGTTFAGGRSEEHTSELQSH